MPPTDELLIADVHRRRRSLLEQLEQMGAGAAVFASDANFRYLTGYGTPSWANRGRSMLLVLLASGECYAVITASEAERIVEDAVDVEPVPYLEPVLSSTDGFSELEFASVAVAAASDILKAAAGQPVAFELGSHLLPGLSPNALQALTASVSAVADISPTIRRLRQRKSVWEIEQIRRASAALELAYSSFAAEAEIGMSERDFSRLFRRCAAASGADWIGYLVVVVGLEGALLGAPTDRRLARDELLLLDAGLLVEGYWSDFSRLYVAGEASVEQARAYQHLVDATLVARESIKPGRTLGDVATSIQRRLPQGAAAFGRFGHGVGLDLSEPPSLHPRDPTVLESGMTLCIEPNASMAGVGNLVVEEIVVVTPEGCELVSGPVPEGLVVIT
jgi:Xaa-Pro aminopeptidase